MSLYWRIFVINAVLWVGASLTLAYAASRLVELPTV